MNKKDMFIRDKLQKDKQISDKADKIFNNFKEEFKLENNEGKKVIKISFNKFLAIAASVAIVGALGTILCVKKPWENKLKSNIQAEQKNEPEINIDEIAKELFEKGAEEIRKLQYSELIESEYGVSGPFIEKEINGRTYTKTNERYEKTEQKYAEIFTDKALEDVLAMRFANVDGILYVIYGGATGWDITNLEIEKVNEENDELTYKASYNDVYIDGSISKERYNCGFSIKKVDGGYRISETNYCNLGEKDEPEINIDEIAKELFEEGAEEIRKLEYAGKPYEIAKPEQKREINGKEYIKTTEKYETVEKKYGQIFTEEALENVLAKKFINVNGILYMENAWRSNRMGYYKFRNRKSK